MKERFWRTLANAIFRLARILDNIHYAAHERVWANYEYGDPIPWWANYDLNHIIIWLLMRGNYCWQRAQRAYESSQDFELPF